MTNYSSRMFRLSGAHDGPSSLQAGHHTAQEGLKTASERPKMALNAPKTVQDGPRGPQENPKAAPRGPQDGLRRARRRKNAPRRPQTALKSPKSAPKRPQEALKPSVMTNRAAWPRLGAKVVCNAPAKADARYGRGNREWAGERVQIEKARNEWNEQRRLEETRRWRRREDGGPGWITQEV